MSVSTALKVGAKVGLYVFEHYRDDIARATKQLAENLTDSYTEAARAPGESKTCYVVIPASTASTVHIEAPICPVVFTKGKIWVPYVEEVYVESDQALTAYAHRRPTLQGKTFQLSIADTENPFAFTKFLGNAELMRALDKVANGEEDEALLIMGRLLLARSVASLVRYRIRYHYRVLNSGAYTRALQRFKDPDAQALFRKLATQIPEFQRGEVLSLLESGGTLVDP